MNAASMTLALATVVAAHAHAEDVDLVKRGEYLARAGDCVACHTAPGGRPFAGGRAIDTGFGLVYTPNITPDKATGIGGWSDDDFWRAMHEGRDDEGRHLYPAFPYPWFTKVSRADVRAIKAYLDSLAPVHQPNRPPQLDWWVSWRALMGPWNVLNFDAGEYRADPTKSAQWNRGAYLVQGLGHCGDCHTPKRTFGGPERSRALEGGSWLGWYAPPLAGAGRGLRDWSRDEIVEFLKTGSTARTASLGRMSEVVEHSTSHFSDDDLRAVATYLKELPAARVDRLRGRRLRRRGRPQRGEVGGHRLQVRGIAVLRAAGHHLGHRAEHRGRRGHAGLEQPHHLGRRPVRDACLVHRRQ